MKFESVEDILRLTQDEVDSLTFKDLKQAVSMAGKRANQRVKYLESKGVNNAVVRNFYKYATFDKSKPNINAGNRSLNQLRHELRRARNVLNAKTSTMKGIHEVEEKFQDRIGGKLSAEGTKAFWEAISKAQELGVVSGETIGSPELHQMMYEVMTDHPDMNPDELALEIKSRIDSRYEEQMEEYNKMVEEMERRAENDGFFELSGDDEMDGIF